jgi:hypothetical protein
MSMSLTGSAIGYLPKIRRKAPAGGPPEAGAKKAPERNRAYQKTRHFVPGLRRPPAVLEGQADGAWSARRTLPSVTSGPADGRLARQPAIAGRHRWYSTLRCLIEKLDNQRFIAQHVVGGLAWLKKTRAQLGRPTARRGNLRPPIAAIGHPKTGGKANKDSVWRR